MTALEKIKLFFFSFLATIFAFLFIAISFSFYDKVILTGDYRTSSVIASGILLSITATLAFLLSRRVIRKLRTSDQSDPILSTVRNACHNAELPSIKLTPIRVTVNKKPEDILVSIDSSMRHLPYRLGKITNVILLVALVLAVLFLIDLAFSRGPENLSLSNRVIRIALPLSILLYFGFATYLRRSIVQTQKNPAATGEFEYILEEKSLSVRNHHTESKYSWAAFESLIETQKYFFFYIAPFYSISIPKAGLDEDTITKIQIAVSRRFN